MAKSRDIPKELKEFNQIFEKLCYRHDYSTVFSDFLTICMAYHACETMNREWQEALSRYDDKEKALINDLYRCWILTMNDILKDEDIKWYDFWGHYYEVLASSSKKSSFGQFFTPEPVCDMIAQMQVFDTKDEKDLKINDPACGSGRLLLAFNALRPGNYFVAQDLDPICCKMTALNMMIHGIKGEVIHGDTLRMDMIGGWIINPRIYTFGGLPHLVKAKRPETKIDEVQKVIENKPVDAHEQNVSRGTPHKRTLI